MLPGGLGAMAEEAARRAVVGLEGLRTVGPCGLVAGLDRIEVSEDGQVLTYSGPFPEVQEVLDGLISKTASAWRRDEWRGREGRGLRSHPIRQLGRACAQGGPDPQLTHADPIEVHERRPAGMPARGRYRAPARGEPAAAGLRLPARPKERVAGRFRRGLEQGRGAAWGSMGSVLSERGEPYRPPTKRRTGSGSWSTRTASAPCS